MKIVLVSVMALAVSAAMAEDEASGAEQPAAPVAAVAAKASFTTLPMCRQVEGRVEIRKTGGEWEEAEEGRFYPLGTSYRTRKGGRLVLAFGPDSFVSISGVAEFGTRAQAIGVTSRTVVLVHGTLSFELADNLPEGAFLVSAPGFVIKNPAGKSTVAYEDKGDGEIATVTCVTGSLGIEGRHFDIPSMGPANEIAIRTSHDLLSTILYGKSGNYVVRLDQGVRTREEIGDDGQRRSVVEKGVAEWHLSPATKVVINRSVPTIGKRMSVHTMAFDAAGERKSECSFCEGRPEVNSGELVIAEKVDEEELAKRAAAETTETTEAADAEDSGSEVSGDSNSSENNQ